MAGGVQVLPSGVQDGTGVPAMAKVSANVRVSTATGPIGIATDVLTFPGPSTVGTWVTANQRVLVNGVATVGQNSSGLAVVPGTPPTTSPISVTGPDPRVSGS